MPHTCLLILKHFGNEGGVFSSPWQDRDSQLVMLDCQLGLLILSFFMEYLSYSI